MLNTDRKFLMGIMGGSLVLAGINASGAENKHCAVVAHRGFSY
jgi:hypothetical protein